MTELRPEFLLTPPQQHTFCHKALIAIHAALDQYEPGAGTGLDKHIAKIRRWLDMCEADVRNKRLSAGAKRDIDAWLDDISRCALCFGLQGDELFNRWCASIVCAELFIFNCGNTCKEWFKGKHWRFLAQTMDTLARRVVETQPGALQLGDDMFMTLG